METDADRSAGLDKPKRRLSAHSASQSPSAEKRPRSGNDDSDVARQQHLDRDARFTSTTQYRPYRPSRARSRSSSGSEHTSLVDGERLRGHESPRTSVNARSTAGPSAPRPGPQRHFSNPRWVTGANKQGPPREAQSSTSSSSSSQPALPRSHQGEDDRGPSPPSLTLSTGQPVVGPPAKTQAAFVGKLFSMLEDDEIKSTGLLHWSNGGSTFTCPNPTEFSKAVLPRFFKHNNWQSFVRQLNMYSFNKVNDLYATSSDPMAWEFRHPLFRQNEPHLLASIKRKTTRPSPAEAPAQSPTDEQSDAGRPIAVAGWMRDDPVPVPESSSPPFRRPKPEVFGYNMKTGETIQARPYEQTARPATKAYTADLRRASRGASASRSSISDQASTRKYHPDPDRPPLSARPVRDIKPNLARYASTSSIPDTAYSQYQQPSIPSPSPLAALANQVAYLEDRVVRLSEMLHVERVENARMSVDLAESLLHIVSWLPNASSLEVSQLQAGLERRRAESGYRYEHLSGPRSEHYDGAPSYAPYTRDTPTHPFYASASRPHTEPHRPLSSAQSVSRYAPQTSPYHPYSALPGPPPTAILQPIPRPSPTSRSFPLDPTRLSPVPRMQPHGAAPPPHLSPGVAAATTRSSPLPTLDASSLFLRAPQARYPAYPAHETSPRPSSPSLSPRTARPGGYAAHDGYGEIKWERDDRADGSGERRAAGTLTPTPAGMRNLLN